MRWPYIYILVFLSTSAQANFELDTLVLDGRGSYNWTLPYCLCGEGERVAEIKNWRPCQLKEEVDLRTPLWIKIELYNADTLQNYFLNHWNKDWYEAWLIQGGDTTKTYGGKYMSASKRSLPHDANYCPIYVEKKKNATLLIRSQAAPSFLPVWIKKRLHEPHFHIHTTNSRILDNNQRNSQRQAGSSFHYFTLGGILVFFFFALAMYRKIQDITFLNYAWYLLLLVLYASLSNANSTDAFEFADFLPKIRLYKNVCIFWLIFLVWLRFIKGLSGIHKEFPRYFHILHRIVTGFSVMAVLAFFYLVITHDLILGKALETFSNLLLLISSLGVVHLFFFKSRSEWRNYIRWAMLVLLVWGFISFLKFRFIDFNQLPYFLNIFFTVQTGSFIDTCIFTFAMATKIRRDQDEKLLLQQKYFETERLAIQARLNPHFLFNSLNAARNLIETQQNKDAREYVLQLSTYLRKVLKINTSEYYSLSDELELAKSYMEIERIRLGRNLEFTLTRADDLDLEEIQFPPLALQPLLENAVWHGQAKFRMVNLNIEEKGPFNWQVHLCDNLGGISSASLEKALEKDAKHTGLKLFKNKIDLFNSSTAFHIKWHAENNSFGGTCFVLKISHQENK